MTCAICKKEAGTTYQYVSPTRTREYAGCLEHRTYVERVMEGASRLRRLDWDKAIHKAFTTHPDYKP